MENIIERGYASFTELKDIGIKKTYDIGVNQWGYRERVIVDIFDNQWDYIPEDQIYEKRSSPHPCTTIRIS